MKVAPIGPRFSSLFQHVPGRDSAACRASCAKAMGIKSISASLQDNGVPKNRFHVLMRAAAMESLAASEAKSKSPDREECKRQIETERHRTTVLRKKNVNSACIIPSLEVSAAGEARCLEIPERVQERR